MTTTARDVMNNATSEKQFQAMIVRAAQMNGWAVYHTYDSRKSTPGFPDLILIRDNVLIAAELKSQKGQVRPEQMRWLKAFAGVKDVRACLWRPAEWDEIEQVLSVGVS